VGAVRLQAQCKGDECHPVPERRHHPSREGNEKVATSRDIV
jgi:hypothetical protein